MNRDKEILLEIERELCIFREDEKSVFGGYGMNDYRELLNRIAFVVQNNNCKCCKKLITYREFMSFECSNCGYSLLESLKNDRPVEKSVKQ